MNDPRHANFKDRHLTPEERQGAQYLRQLPDQKRANHTFTSNADDVGWRGDGLMHGRRDPKTGKLTEAVQRVELKAPTSQTAIQSRLKKAREQGATTVALDLTKPNKQTGKTMTPGDVRKTLLRSARNGDRLPQELFAHYKDSKGRVQEMHLRQRDMETIAKKTGRSARFTQPTAESRVAMENKLKTEAVRRERRTFEHAVKASQRAEREASAQRKAAAKAREAQRAKDAAAKAADKSAGDKGATAKGKGDKGKGDGKTTAASKPKTDRIVLPVSTTKDSKGTTKGTATKKGSTSRVDIAAATGSKKSQGTTVTKRPAASKGTVTAKGATGASKSVTTRGTSKGTVTGRSTSASNNRTVTKAAPSPTTKSATTTNTKAANNSKGINR